MPRTGCTARIAWRALYPDRAKPPDCPEWHHCTRERGHDGAHRAQHGDRVHTWEPMIGGRRDGAGRPSLLDGEARTRRVVVRVRGDELAALEEAAGEDGVGPWLRGLGMRAATRRRRT